MNLKFLKPPLLFSILLPLFFMLIGSGCEDEFEETLWEISSDTDANFIQKEVNGIRYKFCLLNEKGKAATVFNHGENFTFYFSVSNNTKKDLFFIPDYAQSENNDFCRVYDASDVNKGKPFYFMGVDLIGIAGYPFETDKSYIFEQDWVNIQTMEWRWNHGYYEDTNQEPLPPGNYYTGFQDEFIFVSQSNDLTFKDTLEFKINFKIQ